MVEQMCFWRASVREASSLENVELYTMFMLNQDYPFLRGQTEGHITHYGTFVSPPMRAAAKDGFPQGTILAHYSDTDRMVQQRIKPTFMFVQCTPMDSEGYFTMGFNSLGHAVGIEMAERIVVQVNPRLPRILGECNKIHISKVTAVFEEEAQLYTAPKKEVFDETDYKAAQLIADPDSQRRDAADRRRANPRRSGESAGRPQRLGRSHGDVFRLADESHEKGRH